MLYTVKFVDGMPLSRVGRVLERHNSPVPSQTLERWVVAYAVECRRRVKEQMNNKQTRR